MELSQIYANLCFGDERNPMHKDMGLPKPPTFADCGCSNCRAGRTMLALEILTQKQQLTETKERLEQVAAERTKPKYLKSLKYYAIKGQNCRVGKQYTLVTKEVKTADSRPTCRDCHFEATANPCPASHVCGENTIFVLQEVRNERAEV